MLMVGEKLENVFVTVEEGSFCSPCRDDTGCTGYCLQKEVIVFFADRVGDFSQVRGRSGFVGEEVDYFQRAEAPAMGKGETTGDGGVVSQAVCHTGVEHDECEV